MKKVIASIFKGGRKRSAVKSEKRASPGRAVTIRASDGYALTARVFEPAGRPLGKVLMAPALATSHEYYSAFAEWLASAGYLVVTFDYRGTEKKLPERRKIKAEVTDWGRLDCAAVVDYLADLPVDAPLIWIGHSLGGSLFQFAPNVNRVDRIVTIATQNGYWKNCTGKFKGVYLLGWVLAGPALTLTLGYFPGKELGLLGANLPRNAYWQMRRWCLTPSYMVGGEPTERIRELCARVTAPITVITVPDDELFTGGQTRDFPTLPYFVSAKVTRLPIERKEAPHRIGHFGFFRPRRAAHLWDKLIRTELAKARRPAEVVTLKAEDEAAAQAA